MGCSSSKTKGGAKETSINKTPDCNETPHHVENTNDQEQTPSVDGREKSKSESDQDIWHSITPIETREVVVQNELSKEQSPHAQIESENVPLIEKMSDSANDKDHRSSTSSKEEKGSEESDQIPQGRYRALVAAFESQSTQDFSSPTRSNKSHVSSPGTTHSRANTPYLSQKAFGTHSPSIQKRGYSQNPRTPTNSSMTSTYLLCTSPDDTDSLFNSNIKPRGQKYPKAAHNHMVGSSYAASSNYGDSRSVSSYRRPGNARRARSNQKSIRSRRSTLASRPLNPESENRSRMGSVAARSIK